MKKNAILIIGLLVSFSNVISAQEKLATYENSLIGKTFEIQLSAEDNKPFTLYIDAWSLDNLHEIGGFIIKENKYQNFIDALLEAKLKYEEWVETAKKNNITKLDKEMPIKCKVGGYFLYGDKWKFQNVVNLTFDFKITEDSYLLIVRSGQMVSSTNEFMDVKGVVLVFENSTEIQDFINLISIEKINEFKNKPKVEELFK